MGYTTMNKNKLEPSKKIPNYCRQDLISYHWNNCHRLEMDVDLVSKYDPKHSYQNLKTNKLKTERSNNQN